MSSCSNYYLCAVVVSAILQKGSSCRCSAVYGVGRLWLLGFCQNSCVEDTQWGNLDRIRSTGIVRIEGKFDRYLGILKIFVFY